MPPEPRLISCVGVRSDLALLPHFLRHYRRLGVLPARMHLIVHSPDPDATDLDAALTLLSEFGTAAPEIWTDPYTSDGMWTRRRETQAKVASPDDFVLTADVDEFHEYPEPLVRFLARCDRLGANAVQGVFVDRLAKAGRLAPVLPEPELPRQFPLAADVICSLGGEGTHHDRYGSVKLMAVKGNVFPSRGGHHPRAGPAEHRHLFGAPLGTFPGLVDPGFRFAVPLRVHHYHWTAGLPDSLRRRIATPGVSAAGLEYSTKLLAHFDANGGIDLDQVGWPEWNWRGLVPWTLRIRWFRAEARLRDLGRRARDRLKVSRS